MKSSRMVMTGAAAMALLAGGTAAGAAVAASPVSGGVIHGCYTKAATNGSHGLKLQNAGTSCPQGTKAISWNQKGPSGVVSMEQFNPGSMPGTGNSFTFTTASPPVITFTSSHTAAQVTATVDEASTDGNEASGVLGICYEPVGGSIVTGVSEVLPDFQAPANSYFAQTVSGIVGNLTPGPYLVGLCAAADTANLTLGASSGTIILAQTASGVITAGPRHRASQAQPSQAQAPQPRPLRPTRHP